MKFNFSLFIISKPYVSALSFEAMAAFVLSFAFDIISADPAVSALTCSTKLFDLIKPEHWDNAWEWEYTFLISEIFAPGNPNKLCSIFWKYSE